VILPDVAPGGTLKPICVSDQLVDVTVRLPSLIVPGLPNPEPVTCTEVLTGPPFGEKSLTKTFCNEKAMLVGTPPTVKVTEPDTAPVGMVAVINPSDHVTMDRLRLPNFKVLAPCVEPNPLPVICTWVPIAPPLGDIAEMTGLGKVNIKSMLLLIPFT
jgi:hypothetical protein